MKRYLPWVIWGLGALFFFIEYSARVSPSVMNHELMQVFGASGFQLGSLAAFFYYAYAAMQIPVGILVDRFGARRLLTASALCCGVSSILFATASNLIVADIARFLLGFSASFAFVGTLKLARLWFPSSRFGLLAGMTQSIGMLGAAMGEGPLAALVKHVGWRYSSLGLALIFIILGIAIGFATRAKPPKAVNNLPTKWSTVIDGLKIVLRNPRTWINGVAVGFLYAPTAAFAELWGVRFLQTNYAIPHVQAAYAVGMIFIGWTVGAPIAGWCSDKMGKRKLLMMLSALCGLVILTTIIYAPHLPFTVILVLLFFYGVTNTGVALSYVVASEINPYRVSGSAMAFTNMLMGIIGALFQPLVGRLLDLFGNGKVVNGVEVYSATHFHYAMLVLPASMVLSFMIMFFMKEKHIR